MTKVFLILAIIAAAAASYLGWENKKEFSSVSEEYEATQKQVTTIRKSFSKEAAEFNEISIELETEKTARDEAETRLDLAKTKQKNRVDRIAEKNKELRSMETEIAEIDIIINKAGGGGDLDSILPDLEIATEREAELQGLIQEQQDLVDSMRKQVNDKRGVLKSLKQKLSDMDNSFNVKTRRARISAADPEWNFCVINTGNAAGISDGDRAIVVRGGQRIGLLKIKSIESGRIVADVDTETLTPGMSVQAGDSVVFQPK